MHFCLNEIVHHICLAQRRKIDFYDFFRKTFITFEQVKILQRNFAVLCQISSSISVLNLELE